VSAVEGRGGFDLGSGRAGAEAEADGGAGV
jgi:hypothetical protein